MNPQTACPSGTSRSGNGLPFGATRQLLVRVENRGSIRNLPVRVSIYGDVGKPAVFILGGISARARFHRLDEHDRDGWWSETLRHSSGLHAGEFCLLGMDYVVEQGGTDFASTRMQATILRGVLSELHINRIHTLVGASYGANIALSFSSRFPSCVSRLLLLCGAHRSHPFAVGMRHIQRRILESVAGREGVALARQLAMLTYRSPSLVGQRFGRSENATDEIVDYLSHKGREFADRLSTRHYMALSAALNGHRVEPETVTCPTMIAGSRHDLLVPFSELEDLADRLPDCRGLHPFPGDDGHDAFLTTPQWTGQLVNRTVNLETSS